MKYIATFKVYLEGPDEGLLIKEEELGSTETDIYSLVVSFLDVLSQVSNVTPDKFVPYNARITADVAAEEEQGDVDAA